MGGILEKIINSKSRTFISLCFCFLVGVLVISVVDKKIPLVYLYISLFISVSFIIIYWKNLKFHFVLLCLSVLLFGVLRYQLAFPVLKNSIASFAGRKAIITGYVVSEPDVRQDRVNYIVNLQNNLRGKVYFKYQLYPRFNYGDKLQINCELQAPEAFDDFRYDRYLANQGVFVICDSPQVEKIGDGAGNFVLKNILWLKNKVAEQVSALWQEPYAGFMAGLLYGYRGGLGELNNLFVRTGITHIVAVSGYNITIIAAALMAILINLYVPRKKAFWIIVAGIILFVIFTGASASVVRAGIMGILVLTAKHIGRLSRIVNVLMFTAFFMVLINPFVLLWDAGFQLSFLSTLGLIYLSPVIGILINKLSTLCHCEVADLSADAAISRRCLRLLRPLRLASLAQCPRNDSLREISGNLKEIFISTLSAIIATLPLILFQFGRLSIVALPVNILVLWIIPFLMLGGFLAVIFSFIFFPFGQVIAWITWVGMKYIVVIVEWFGNLKFAAIDLTIPWWLMIIMYIGIIYVIWQKKLKF